MINTPCGHYRLTVTVATQIDQTPCAVCGRAIDFGQWINHFKFAEFMAIPNGSPNGVLVPFEPVVPAGRTTWGKIRDLFKS